MTLEGLIEHDTHYESPTFEDALESIKQMVMDSLRVAKQTAGAMLMALMLGAMPMRAQASVEMTSTPVEIVINNNSANPVFEDVEVAYPQHYRMEKRIIELASLEEGWDQAGAMRISNDALMMAGHFSDLLSERVLSHCSLFPAADSGVLLQGKFDKGSLIVSFSDGSLTYVLKGVGVDRKAASRVPLVKETVKLIDSIISSRLLA